MKHVNHTHKYLRSKNRRNIYRCAFPFCTHYNVDYFLIGKASICNICGAEFELTEYDLKRAKPRCGACKKGKRGIVAKRKEEFVSSILERVL